VLEVLQMLLEIDKTLGVWIDQYGIWIYVILFLIVFGETGFVVLPFLPGDTLLFIAGAFAANGSMSAPLLIALLLVAAIAGNTVNYFVGRWVGIKIYDMHVRWLDKDALRKTHDFYERHGGKTLVLARFVPIVRTFAPFVAGVSEMTFARFQFFNVAGALAWVVGLVMAGFFFGNLPIVRDHLNTIVLVGVAAAVVPLILGAAWKGARRLMRPRVS
jgi:membrane-associated protein